MNKLFKIGSRALLGAMVCGCSYFAPAAAADDMAAFREALTKPAVQDTRIMRENISFFVKKLAFPLNNRIALKRYSF